MGAWTYCKKLKAGANEKLQDLASRVALDKKLGKGVDEVVRQLRKNETSRKMLDAGAHKLRRHQCKQARSIAASIVQHGVRVTDERKAELRSIGDRINADQGRSIVAFKVLAINLKDSEPKTLEKSLSGCEVIDRCLTSEDFGGAMAVVNKSTANVVVLQAESPELLNELEQSVVALAFISGLPVIVLASEGSKAASAAQELTGGIWPTFDDAQAASLWLASDAPPALALTAEVEADLAGRLTRHGEVDMVNHLATRAPLSIVPFGVSVANTSELVYVVGRMLVDAGMVTNKEGSKKVAGLGFKAAFAEQVVGVPVDVLQAVVAGGITSTAWEGLQQEGVQGALDSLDAMDAFTLGATGMLTGAVSSLCAASTRPTMVASITSFLAAQQTTLVLNGKLL